MVVLVEGTDFPGCKSPVRAAPLSSSPAITWLAHHIIAAPFRLFGRSSSFAAHLCTFKTAGSTTNLLARTVQSSSFRSLRVLPDY